MNTDLTGNVALVMGVSQGIGEAIARALHREDAKVALIARTQAKLDAVARELGDRAFAIAADVLDATSLSRGIATAEKRLGPIDIAVNTCGQFGRSRCHRRVPGLERGLLHHRHELSRRRRFRGDGVSIHRTDERTRFHN